MIWNDLKDIFRMKIKVMREIPYSIEYYWTLFFKKHNFGAID